MPEKHSNIELLILQNLDRGAAWFNGLGSHVNFCYASLSTLLDKSLVCFCCRGGTFTLTETGRKEVERLKASD